MSSVDERVVSMEFDNKQFEDGVKTTMTTLDNLEEKLQFEGAGKGLDELGKLGNNFTFGNLGDTIDDIGERFTALGIIGMTALQNITNKAVDAGLEMAKALSVDQLSAGFSKYEENTSNIVALMNQLPEGEQSMESVEGHMKKLSWYSDATSFDLVAMTSALKKFAAQGMSAEQSIPIIMGIGNSITYAGVGAKEGSEAFDIFAKAIANGNLSLIQWKQLANRGIVTAQTKKDLMEAAVAEGTLVKVGEDLYKTNQGLEVSMKEFDSTLNAQKGKWVTQGVIERVFGGKYGTYTDLLSDYTLELQEQTGEVISLDDAMKKFEVDFGDLNDEMAFGQTALKSATEAKTFTEAIDAVKDAMSTQWMSVFQSIFGNAKEAKKLWTDVNTVLVDTFVPPVANLALLLAEWKELGGRNDLIEGFTNLGKAIKAVVGPIKEAFRNVFPAMSGKVLADATAGFKNFTEKLILSEEVGDRIRSVFEVVFQVFKTIGTVIGGIVKVGSKVVQLLSPIISFVFKLIGGAAQLIEKLADTIKNSEAYAKVLSKFQSIAESVKSAFLAIISVFGDSEVATRAAEERGGKFYETFVKIRDKLKPVADTLASFFERIGNGVKKAFNWNSDLSFIDNIKAKFSNLQKTLEPITQKVRDLIDKIKIAITSLFSKDEAASEEDSTVGNASNALTTINNVLGKVANGIVTAVNFIFDAFRKLFGGKKEGMDPTETGTMMENFADKLSRVKERMMGFVEDLGTVFDTTNAGLLGLLIFNLSKFFKGLDKTVRNGLGDVLKGLEQKLKADSFKSIGEGIDEIGGALLKIAIAVGILSLIPAEKVGNGLAALGMISVMFTVMSLILDKLAGLKFNAQTTVLAFTAAVLGMAIAVSILAKLNIVRALTATIDLSVLIGAMSKALKKLDGVNTTQVSKLTIFGTTLLLMAKAVKKLSGIPYPDIIWGTLSLVSVIFSMAAAMKILGNSGDVDASASALFKFSAAIGVMSIVIKSLSSLTGDELESAVLGIAAALGSLVLGLLLVSMMDANNVTKAAAAMVIMAAAMTLLIIPMMAFKNLDPKEIGIGLLALAGAFAVVGVAGLLLQGVSTPIFLLASALLEASIAIGVASIGLALLGPALALLATTIVASAPIILLAIKTIIAGISSLGADVAIAVASLIAAVCTAIINSIDSIIQTIRAVLNAIAVVLLEFVPTAILIILTLVEMVIRALALTMDTLVDSVVTLLLSFIIAVADGLRKNANTIIYAFLDVLEAVVEALIKTIAMLIPGVGSVLVNSLDNQVFPVLQDRLGSAKGKLIGEDFVGGISDGIAGSNLIQDALDAAGDFSLGETKLGETLGFGNGKKQGTSFAKGASDGISGSLLDFSEVTGLLGETGVESFSGVFNGEAGFDLGSMFGEGVAEGIESEKEPVEKSTEEMIETLRRQNSTAITHVGHYMDLYRGLGVKGAQRFSAELLTAYKDALKVSQDAADDVMREWYSMGKYISQGLINGITDNTARVEEAGKNLGFSVTRATKNSLAEKSPSKVFVGIGQYVDEGLAIGLTRYSSVAEKASANVAENTIDSASSTLRSLTDVINSDSDFQPVISPVLDLTNVQNGTNSLNNMMTGKNLTASITSRLTTDYDNTYTLMAEIAKLRSDMQDMVDSNQLNPDSIGSAVRSALEGTGVYMERDKVGKLLTSYQNNTRRASGAY